MSCLEPDAASVVGSSGFNCLIYFAPVFEDDSCISMGPFMQTKHLCVLIYYIINDEVGTVKLV